LAAKFGAPADDYLAASFGFSVAGLVNFASSTGMFFHIAELD
jgi:hypothetical protein